MVRFAADPNGSLHGGGIGVAFFQSQAFSTAADHSASGRGRFSRGGNIRNAASACWSRRRGAPAWQACSGFSPMAAALSMAALAAVTDYCKGLVNDAELVIDEFTVNAYGVFNFREGLNGNSDFANVK